MDFDIFVASPKSVDGKLRNALPALSRVRVNCPVEDCDLAHGGESSTSLYWMIIDLNDSHRWSRERIADWLELMSEQHGIDLTFPVPEDGVGSGQEVR